MDNQTAMKCRIHALDFAILEMELFLDTHPEDQKALRARHVYRQKRETVVNEYERMYGPYIVTSSDVPCDADRWIWINSPWPWEMTMGG